MNTDNPAVGVPAETPRPDLEMLKHLFDSMLNEWHYLEEAQARRKFRPKMKVVLDAIGVPPAVVEHHCPHCGVIERKDRICVGCGKCYESVEGTPPASPRNDLTSEDRETERYRYERPALKIVEAVKEHLLPAMHEEEGGWLLGEILDLIEKVQCNIRHEVVPPAATPPLVDSSIFGHPCPKCGLDGGLRAILYCDLCQSDFLPSEVFPVAPPSTMPPTNDIESRTLGIVRLLYDLKEDVLHAGGVQPQFDSGCLDAAREILMSTLDTDSERVKAEQKRQCESRLNLVMFAPPATAESFGLKPEMQPIVDELRRRMAGQ